MSWSARTVLFICFFSFLGWGEAEHTFGLLYQPRLTDDDDDDDECEQSLE
jgi:hypothetical protein